MSMYTNSYHDYYHVDCFSFKLQLTVREGILPQQKDLEEELQLAEGPKPGPGTQHDNFLHH